MIWLMLELVNAVVEGPEPPSDITPGGTKKYRTVSDYLDKADTTLRDVYEELKSYALALGDDVQLRVTKYYFAFKRIKNFLCVEVHPQVGKLLLFVKVDPCSINLEEGFTRDVREIGHFGTGNLEITVSSRDDMERAKPLIQTSYEAS